MLAIRKFRLRKNLTQAQLASLVGVSAAAVTQWEAGDRKPDIVMLKKLATVLDCSADELLTPITFNPENPL